jgi:hypothetical protein
MVLGLPQSDGVTPPLGKNAYRDCLEDALKFMEIEMNVAAVRP